MKTKTNKNLECGVVNSGRNFIWQNAVEAPAVAPREVPKTEHYPLNSQVVFDKTRPWQTSVDTLLRAAYGDHAGKYQPKFGKIIEKLESRRSEFEGKLEDTARFNLTDSVLELRDDDGDVLTSISLNNEFTEIASEMYEGRRETVMRRYERLRIYYRKTWRQTPTDPALLWLIEPAPKKVAPVPRTPEETPLTPAEIQMRSEVKALLEEKGADRKGTLDGVAAMKDQAFDIDAAIDPKLQHADRRTFEQRWPATDSSEKVDQLFKEEPNSTSGYTVNPFKDQKWEAATTLREFLENCPPGKLYFRDVAKEIYNKRYEDFKKLLKSNKYKISNEVVGLLDSTSIFAKIPLVDKDDSLQVTYERMRDLDKRIDDVKNPKDIKDAEVKKFYEKREEIKTVIKILGDYIVYAARLTNLVSRLKYVPEIAGSASRVMRLEGMAGTPEWQIKHALGTLFPANLTPTAYTSEFWHLASRKQRPINFTDLNGTTATVQGEWFTEEQSPDAAYKLALEQAQTGSRDSRGIYTGEFNAEAGKNHLNNLLQMGIAAGSVLPEGVSLKAVLDELAKNGAQVNGETVRFTGNIRTDNQTLFAALQIPNLTEINNPAANELAKLKNTLRSRYIRIGSVIYQKSEVMKQRRLMPEKAPTEAPLKVIIPEAQAAEICKQLAETKKFTPPQLERVKSALVGGVVVTPAGGALSINLPFENGVSLNITGQMPVGESGATGLGIAATKKIELTKDWSVTISAAAGGGFSRLAGWGAGVGAGFSVTRKFKPVDITLEAGGGFLAFANIPTAFAGVGIDWSKAQEKYEEKITQEKARLHIDELDKKGNIYTEVSCFPAKYPEFHQILTQIRGIAGLNQQSQRDMFLAAYAIMREEIYRGALQETTPRHLSPTNIGLGIAFVGNLPVPYAYLGFNAWNRHLVYRIATADAAQKFTETDANKKILEQYQKDQKAVGDIKLEKPLRMEHQLVVDPKTGQLMLKSGSTTQVDFGHLDTLTPVQRAFANEAKILVEPKLVEGKKQILQLTPKEAYGNIKILIDPELGEDIVLTTNGKDIFLSAKSGAQLFVKREDISYPFEYRGAVEQTYITISKRPVTSREVIEERSAWALESSPGHQWVKRTSGEKTTTAEGKPKVQTNIKDLTDFNTWIGGRTDRLEVKDAAKEMTQAREDFLGILTLPAGDLEVRQEVVRGFIDKLKTDAAFMTRYRALTTSRLNIPIVAPKQKRRRGPKPSPETVTEWTNDIPALIKELKNRFETQFIGKPTLNAMEMNAVFAELIISSFRDVQGKTPEERSKDFNKFFESFHMPIMASAFEEFYKDAPEKDKKVEAALAYMKEQLGRVDINAKGETVAEGDLFSTFVGTERITGIRSNINFTDSGAEFGLLGKTVLNPASAKEEERDMALFWLDYLSPYKKGAHGDKALKKSETGYKEWEEQIYKNLNSPFVLKLAPYIAVVFTPAELQTLGEIYKTSRTPRRLEINDTDFAPVKKYLDLCDKVRDAQLAGTKEIPLEEPFSLLIDFNISTGIYKKCGNVSGVVHEQFGLVNRKTKKVSVAAGMSEGVINVVRDFERVDFRIMAGAALPLPQETRIRMPDIKEPKLPDIPEVKLPPGIKQNPPPGAGQADASGAPGGSVSGSTGGASGGAGGGGGGGGNE